MTFNEALDYLLDTSPKKLERNCKLRIKFLEAQIAIYSYLNDVDELLDTVDKTIDKIGSIGNYGKEAELRAMRTVLSAKAEKLRRN